MISTASENKQKGSMHCVNMVFELVSMTQTTLVLESSIVD